MKIAIVRLSALGDIIQSSIVLQFIRKLRPNAKIHWFVDARFKGLLENHPLIDKLYALPLKDKKILEICKELFALRKEKYDIVIDLQGLIKSAFLARVLSANIFGFDRQSCREGLAANFYKYKLFISYDENIIIRNLSLISYAFNEDFNELDILAKLPCFKANEALKEGFKAKLKLNESSPNILIHTGSSVANKIYPKERLAILAQLLTRAYEGGKIFLAWGNKNEREFALELVRLSALDESKITLLPKLSLSELIALTTCMDLIIGNDSGPTHLAFAMNKPSITIFGATPSHRNAYETSINKVIDSGKKIPNAKNLDKSDFCIQNIEEEKIFTLANELLQGQ